MNSSIDKNEPANCAERAVSWCPKLVKDAAEILEKVL
jgi:hypothetical protein